MIDKAEKVRPSSQNDNLVVKSDKERRCSRLFSSSDLEFSWPVFSTPTDKLSPRRKTEMNTENNTSKPKTSLSPLNRLTNLPSEVLLTPTEDDIDQNRSSEPEAAQSPNQQSVIVNEQQENSCVSSEDEAALQFNSEREKVLVTDQMILHDGMYREVDNGSSGCEEANQQRNERLFVPVTDQHTEKSLPKGSLVDCSTQCSEILCFKCGNTNLEPSRRHFIKPLDNRDKAQAHMQKNQRRNGIQEEQSSQQRGFKGNSSKPERSTGGNRKHTQH
ncbi:uncharacterized protein [Antennarius striatus]|uniref:uncharacterized protein n=1 Tax=Antennarius striatus TaxID=241820 RepID=UPI0035B430C9